MDHLDRRVAVVTGGASGIGAGLVTAFAAAGMRTVVADIDLPGASAVATRTNGTGPASIAVHVDVAETVVPRAGPVEPFMGELIDLPRPAADNQNRHREGKR